jgi:hypothetical protein
MASSIATRRFQKISLGDAAVAASRFPDAGKQSRECSDALIKPWRLLSPWAGWKAGQVGESTLSYDLVVFDPAAAPRDRASFLDWAKYALSAADGQSRSDLAATSSTLSAWHNGMCRMFPAGDGPRAHDPFSTQATRNATYRFASHAILAGFHWEVSGAALHHAKKLALTHGVGLFDVSGADGAVWIMSDRGRYEIAHRNEDAERRSLGSSR